MRFAPILPILPYAAHCTRPAFSAHSWLYCRRDIGYQAGDKGHGLALFGGESHLRKATDRHGEGPPTVTRDKGTVEWIIGSHRPGGWAGRWPPVWRAPR